MHRWLRRNKDATCQFIRFGIVGTSSALVYALVTWSSIQFFNLRPPEASVIGYVISIPMNFLGQRNFAFVSEGSQAVEFFKFCLVHVVNAVLAHIIMNFVTENLQWSYLWGIALVILIIPFCSYFWLTVFVFTKPKS